MQHSTALVGAAVAAAVFGGTSGASAAPAPATPVKPVAYVRGGAIFLGKGTTETRLTEDVVNGRPRFAPDGRRIAYLHKGTVWVMNADGTGKRQVSDRIAGGPAWAPDGRSIAFEAIACTGGPGVYSVSSTTLAPTPTVLFPASCRGEALPEVASVLSGPARGATLADRLRTDGAVAWSPDGKKIAFPGGECDSVADACLTVGTVATGAEKAIDVYGGGGVEASGFGVLPAWRTDGRRVAWTAYVDGASPVHLEEADANGANRRSIGAAQDREMVYLSTGKGLLTTTEQGRSTMMVVDLATGARTHYRAGSQPSVQP